MKMTTIRKYAVRAGAVALCSAALCSAPMMAQGGGGGGRGDDPGPARVATIDKAVTLTDDQKTKVMAILTDAQKKMADLRASGEDSRTCAPKMMAMRTDENTKIKALLTDDQKTEVRRDASASAAGRVAAADRAAGAGGPPPQLQ